MVGWHHRLNGHGFGWTPGVGDGQGGLAFTGEHGKFDLTSSVDGTLRHEDLMQGSFTAAP